MQLPVPGSPPPQRYHYPVSNGGKPPRIDSQFATSPQYADGGEEVIIQHYSHPNHSLAQITVPADLFVCGGCREYGAGKRFACQECNFQLHDFCASSPPAIRGHPLHPQHQLVFHSRPKQAGITWPRCDICGKSIKGFTFRCRACRFQMHPCCARLSTEITFPPTPPPGGNDHQHSLKLQPPGSQLTSSNTVTTTTTTTTTSTNNNNNTMVVGGGGQQQAVLCGECNRKRSGGRMYRCTVCNYHLHARCAKTMINGLWASGMAAPEKPNKSMLGTAARLASQVVIEFIGGLIEGIGEGVGQELIQSIGRGRSRRRGRGPQRPPETSPTPSEAPHCS